MYAITRWTAEIVSGEAVMAVTFLRNRCLARGNGMEKSPYQVWTGRKPVLANLKMFGCYAFVIVPKEKRRNLILDRYAVGFSVTRRIKKNIKYKYISYRFEEIEGGRVLVSRDAKFMEDII